MKRFAAILLSTAMLLALCAGCGAQSPVIDGEAAGTSGKENETAKTPAVQIEERFLNDPFEIHTPTTGDSQEVDPGSTLATWDLSRADNYPADTECTDMQLFEKWMAVEGLTEEDLAKRGCRQLVLVAASQGCEYLTSTICLEQGDDGVWAPAAGFRRMIGYTGTNGINHDRVQGDVTSPAGLWQLGTCFGNDPMPEGLKMDWLDITPNSEWVGDNNSIYYNTWQELDDPDLEDSWDSDEGEHLEDYTNSYAYSCVIRFNMAPYTRRNVGAAIFFHCSGGSTAGCIGLAKSEMKSVMLWMDPAMHPYILITGYEQ